MRVLALVPYPYDIVGSQRYRIEQWQPLLERDHGIEITYAPFLDDATYRVFPHPGHIARKITGIARGLARRAGDVIRARRWDAVFVHRGAAIVGPALFEPLLARRVPYVFDFDDAIFIPQVSESNRAFAFLKSASKTATICRLAAHISVGNEFLAGYARRHNPNVTVIPSTIDTDKYRPRAKRDPGLPVIGWSGSATTAMYINEARDMLAELAKTHRFRLRIIGPSRFEPVPGVETEVLPWTSASEVEDLSELDIGLMPLRDEPWERGKCGLKALQYMAIAIPAVVSPVGVNTEIVQHGVNGFLASTREEWLARLGELLESAELRHRLGAAARQTVETRYSARAQVPRLAGIFHSLMR